MKIRKNMEVIKGYIDHFIFRNSETGFGVVCFVSQGEEVVLVGTFQDVDIGDNLEVSGEFVEHAVYGEELKVSSYKIVMPDDIESMQRYLGSGAIKGIGEALAKKIVKKFGADTFRVIEDEPERLEEIKGISERKAIDISKQMADKREMREAMMFMQTYGISNAKAVKVYNTYGAKIYGILKENPYQLADDIDGIGFKTADEIASKIGISVDSEYRVRSGILYALQQSSADGNSYLPRQELIDKGVELLGVAREEINLQIDNMIVDRKLITKDGTDIYSIQYYYVEQGCASMLYDLNINDDADRTPEANARKEKQVKKLESDLQIELDDLQRKAVMESITSGVTIITGGPGTGKTTTINTIIKYYEKEGLDIMLAAPTGRAAKRMTETTGYEAKTIHRLLEVSGQVSDDKKAGIHFEKNQENPLETDALIIDEMSMVDMHLFYALLKAVVPGVHLILVGDSSQLPSVGPGQVLKDLIDSGKFPTIILQKIFRQAEESDIV
ncbi:MAG: AAA family ATPase, partial [Butyrivibrio sp.]|nr:AAA family ATPase [Butyrivibrio sp.]